MAKVQTMIMTMDVTMVVSMDATMETDTIALEWFWSSYVRIILIISKLSQEAEPK